MLVKVVKVIKVEVDLVVVVLLLVEMLEVWAECLTNSRLVAMTVYNFTTKFNHQVHDPETGGRRYLIDMDVDYDMITDQVKASTELKRTIRALENLLA